jgi:hypothetical protein
MLNIETADFESDFNDEIHEFLLMPPTAAIKWLETEQSKTGCFVDCQITNSMMLNDLEAEGRRRGDNLVDPKFIYDLLVVYERRNQNYVPADYCAEVIPDFALAWSAEASAPEETISAAACLNEALHSDFMTADLLGCMEEEEDEDGSAEYLVRNVLTTKTDTELQCEKVLQGPLKAHFFDLEARVMNDPAVKATLPSWYHVHSSKSTDSLLQNKPVYSAVAASLSNMARVHFGHYSKFHHNIVEVESGPDSLYHAALVAINLTKWFQLENIRRADNAELSGPMNAFQLRRSVMAFLVSCSEDEVIVDDGGPKNSFLELFRKTHCINGDPTTYTAAYTFNVTSIRRDLEDRCLAKGRQTDEVVEVIAAWRLMCTRTEITSAASVLRAMKRLQAHKLRFLACQRAVFETLCETCIAGFGEINICESTDLHISAIAQVFRFLSIDSYSLQLNQWTLSNSTLKTVREQMSAPQYISIALLHVNTPTHVQYFPVIDIDNANNSLPISDTLERHSAKLIDVLYNYRDVDLSNGDVISEILTAATVQRQAQETINFTDFVAFVPPLDNNI